MSRRKTILLAVTMTPALAVIGFLIVYATNHELRNWVYYYVRHRD